jgi:hypothetical protein
VSFTELPPPAGPLQPALRVYAIRKMIIKVKFAQAMQRER